MPKGVYKRKSWEERFWEKVDRNGPVPRHRPELGNCWVWTASTGVSGYGQFWWNREMWKPHRISWMIEHGSIDETHLMHLCDNPICVRPSHLQKGSLLENNADRDAKGRTAKGEGHYAAKLTAVQVVEIRSLYARGVSKDSLAADFHCTRENISMIVSRRSWKDLE